MRVIFISFCCFFYVWGINYNITPSDARGGRYANQNPSGRVNLSVTPAPNQASSHRSQLGVKIQPSPQNTSRASSPVDISIKQQNLPTQNQSKLNRPNVVVLPPVPQSAQSQKNRDQLNIRVYPPAFGNDARNTQNVIVPSIGQSRPITQDMMFQKTQPYKMKLPPRKKQVVKVQAPPPQPQNIIEYEGEDIEPLFVRNRNGVMVGAGIGGSVDRLWVSGNGGNARFYDGAFAYFFRLGYQFYFTKYLGIRAYAHLGDWSNQFSETFFDGERNVVVDAKMSLNFNFYAELLYDFVVLENHSFGVFGGFGIGVGYGEFSNDGTETISEYYGIPSLALGFAYTLFENNRFELESKIPLRSEILKTQWRSKLSTWLIGVSYTYIF